MPLHWPTFFTRLGSAIVFAAIMMTGLLWNEWAFLVLVLLIQTLCLREYFRLMEQISGEHYSLFIKAGIVIFGAAWLLLAGLKIFAVDQFRHTANINMTTGWADLDSGGLSVIARLTSLIPLLLCLPILFILHSGLSKKSSLNQGLKAMGSLFYIILPCTLLLYLYLIDRTIPLALVLMIWTNDTMAYLVGSFIGKTPFSEISPKKTWEGTAGGALLTVIGAGLIAWFCKPDALLLWILLSFCAAIAGTAGDLLESKLKRLANVKDSGTMMPGHGGALDRFDSLLVAVPFAFACVHLLQLLR